MKLFFHLLATFSLVQGNNDFPSCVAAGGPHGGPFDDSKLLRAGQTLVSIKLCGGHRVDGVGVTVVHTDSAKQEPFHGSENDCQVSNLGSDECITSFEVHTVEHKGRTRIGYIKLMNEAGHIYESGKMSKDEKRISTCKAPTGYQFGGFAGREGKEIDALAPLWVPIQADQPLPPPATVQTVLPAPPTQPPIVHAAPPVVQQFTPPATQPPTK